ncbi:MAG: hypothetical protein DWH91_18225 [Planctomycetota bacterium]|nr:MAG: hypothetical protein DWH91_18225 [Planctomycetota bacterium]
MLLLTLFVNDKRLLAEFPQLHSTIRRELPSPGPRGPSGADPEGRSTTFQRMGNREMHSCG